MCIQFHRDRVVGFISPDQPSQCPIGTEPDVWSFGCVLLRALADFVFDSGMASAMRRAGQDMREMQILWPQLINLPCQDMILHHAFQLCAQLLHLDPAQRVSMAKALEAPFFSGKCADSCCRQHRMPLKQLNSNLPAVPSRVSTSKATQRHFGIRHDLPF